MNSQKVRYEYECDDLISIKCFLDELGMRRSEFLGYRKAGRVEGLIRIGGHYVVSRKNIDILQLRAICTRFKIWVEIGGRNGVVSVSEELVKRKRCLSRNWSHFMKGKYDKLPDFLKQKRIGVSGNT